MQTDKTVFHELISALLSQACSNCWSGKMLKQWPNNLFWPPHYTILNKLNYIVACVRWYHFNMRLFIHCAKEAHTTNAGESWLLIKLLVLSNVELEVYSGELCRWHMWISIKTLLSLCVPVDVRNASQ